MTFAVNVRGGTHAGWRRVKELTRWTCGCGSAHITYSTSCCGDRRPFEHDEPDPED